MIIKFIFKNFLSKVARCCVGNEIRRVVYAKTARYVNLVYLDLYTINHRTYLTLLITFYSKDLSAVVALYVKTRFFVILVWYMVSSICWQWYVFNEILKITSIKAKSQMTFPLIKVERDGLFRDFQCIVLNVFYEWEM